MHFFLSQQFYGDHKGSRVDFLLCLNYEEPESWYQQQPLVPIHILAAAAAAAKSLQSCLTLCNPIDAAHQAPLPLGFSRQESTSLESPNDLVTLFWFSNLPYWLKVLSFIWQWSRLPAPFQLKDTLCGVGMGVGRFERYQGNTHPREWLKHTRICSAVGDWVVRAEWLDKRLIW